MIRLEAGDYRAEVTPVGGALVALQYRGRDLVTHAAANTPTPPYRGAVLVPWPNRIADGRYEYAGVVHQLPINEVTRGCALHGLLLWTTWQPAAVSMSEAVLADAIWPRPGYPFALDVAVQYTLDAIDGLTITVTARNTGAQTAPYGTAVHPYLVAGLGSVNDWTLQLSAAHILDVDPDRLLPRECRPVADTEFDFRAGRRIGATEIDHTFTGLDFAPDNVAGALLMASDGSGVRMAWGESCRWVQVHTTDLPGTAAHRTGLALEPMTCPPDAFNTGKGLVRLGAGERHAAWCRIAAVEPP